MPRLNSNDMVLWGAIWGAVLGLVTSRGDFLQALIGAALGAAAGSSLRNAVRKEVERLSASRGSVSPRTATEAPATMAPSAAQARLQTAATAATVAAAPAAMPTQTVEWASATEFSPASSEPAAATGMAANTVPAPPDHWGTSVDREAPFPDLGWRVQGLARVRHWLLGGNTIVRLGLLVLFIGLAFLAKYAAEHSLLPPELRLAGIGISGIVLLVFGWRMQAKQPRRAGYALSLQGGGIAVLYLTVFAAFRLYQFLPAAAAFATLAVICALATTIALLQNALAMALIGFAGAFAAPLLVSTDSGNHVALFSYYLLLGVAIAIIAWVRAWRPLNLLGFVATFGIASVWGVLEYKPGQFASTEPFLVAFFLVYLVASVLYATRHALGPRQGIDTTLVFGNPLVALGLQVGLVHDIEFAAGFSALALGGFYLALGFVALRYWSRRAVPKTNDAVPGADRHRDSRQAAVKTDDAMPTPESPVGRWLAECFVALGLGFVTLAVPLALDPRWTSAVWAAEGVGIYWIGRRQQRTRARAVGLGLQLLGALAYLASLDRVEAAAWPLAHPAFVGASLLAGSALVLAHWCRTPQGGPVATGRLARLESMLATPLFWVGFLWAQFALGTEITRMHGNPQGPLQPALEPLLHHRLQMLAWLAGTFLAHWLALPARRRPWLVAASPAWFSVPIMLLVALDGLVLRSSGFGHGGWWIWPLALVLHYFVLLRLGAHPAPGPARLWSWIHSAGVWLVVLVAGTLLYAAVERADLFATAWAAVILLVAGTAVLLLLTRRSLFDPASAARGRWPLETFAQAYLWRAAAPLATLVALGSLAVAVRSNGNAAPLPYIPLLNPTDLAIALGILTCALWWSRVRGSGFVAAPWNTQPQVPALLGVIAFVGLNTVWLRIAHHHAGVRWEPWALFDSFLVQAGYSILWTLLALGLMVTAHRRQLRAPWMVGGALLGATVLKLFLIDLSNRGGGERIVVFIAVGMLMLVVGYFAPLPPRARSPQGTSMPAPTAQEPLR